MTSKDIIIELGKYDVDFVRFVDVSKLQYEQNKGLPNAILFGLSLSPGYLREVANTPDYVRARIDSKRGFDDDEFYLTEMKTGDLSDHIAEILISKGYKAYSQSDGNQEATNNFDGIYGKTPLPHKTLAVMAGIGWIGRNNLLITPEYGCGLCLGVILTDIPLDTTESQIMESKCGNCRTCLAVCDVNTLTGCDWNRSVTREDMINVYGCTTCMQCLAHCTYSQKYINSL